MLNVLLVDDEKLERVLIRKGYNWEENGFNIVGEAASGEDALEYIKGDEYVEVTPHAIRLRKIYLDENDRKRMAKK